MINLYKTPKGATSKDIRSRFLNVNPTSYSRLGSSSNKWNRIHVTNLLNSSGTTIEGITVQSIVHVKLTAGTAGVQATQYWIADNVTSAATPKPLYGEAGILCYVAFFNLGVVNKDLTSSQLLVTLEHQRKASASAAYSTISNGTYRKTISIREASSVDDTEAVNRVTRGQFYDVGGYYYKAGVSKQGSRTILDGQIFKVRDQEVKYKADTLSIIKLITLKQNDQLKMVYTGDGTYKPGLVIVVAEL